MLGFECPARASIVNCHKLGHSAACKPLQFGSMQQVTVDNIGSKRLNKLDGRFNTSRSGSAITELQKGLRIRKRVAGRRSESNQQWRQVSLFQPTLMQINRQTLGPPALQAGDHLQHSPPSVVTNIQIRPEHKTVRGIPHFTLNCWLQSKTVLKIPQESIRSPGINP